MKGILFFSLLILSHIVFGQDKVQWTAHWDGKVNKVIIDAKIQEGWHLYSQHIKNDVGPVPTAFVFEPSAGISLKGSVSEPKAIEEFDPNFEANLTYFKEKVQFTQEIEKKNDGLLKLTITYMVCNDVMCLPPVDKVLSIQIH